MYKQSLEIEPRSAQEKAALPQFPRVFTVRYYEQGSDGMWHGVYTTVALLHTLSGRTADQGASGCVEWSNERIGQEDLVVLSE